MKKIFQNMLMAIFAFMVFPDLCQGGVPYDLSWSTTDSGCGRSTGGPYVLTGSIAQPDAGYSACGGYELFGGFWAISCFPYWHPDYNDWIDVARPPCWCYPRQCHGDADGLSQGKGSYWVSSADLNILLNAWGRDTDELKTWYPEGLCADFDRLPECNDLYRVHSNDLDILIKNWGTSSVPDDCIPGNVTP